MPKLNFIIGLAVLAVAYGDFPSSLERDILTPERHDSDIEDFSRIQDEAYRLPETVTPIEYDVYLDLYFEERTEKPYSFDGKVDIVIQAAQQNVSQIVLHANVNEINSVTLSRDGVPQQLDGSNPIVLEPQYHFLKINLVQALELGVNYTLTINYENTMNEGPMKRGLWRGWYRDGNGTERVYATTHFQPYNARQAFPCWDEPGFKSVFRLHLSKPATYRGIFTNTGINTTTFLDNNRVRDSFHATPKMSSYLVSLLVSETFIVIAEDKTFDPPIRIIGRSNTAGMGDYALELAVGMTKFFDEYFGIPYSSMHRYLSNDHIASPDWASAGTENWGLVSYRELYMIIDPRETIMSVESYAATLISHELAHKWFGNLITCYWWSNTWINEGYASYFGYIGAHRMFEKYELIDHFNGRYMHATLSYDSSASSEPMNHPVNTPQQVTAHFGTISYSKAASFIRQTVNIISEETFRKSCNYFLVDNAFQPTDQFDLLAAFQKAIQEDNALAAFPDFDFDSYYSIWVNIPGYPILTVNVDHETGVVELSQERFLLSGSSASEQVYPIPITYSQKSNSQFSDVTPWRMMTTETLSVQINAGDEWVFFNNIQHGIYRVNYDDKTWDLNAEVLYNDPDSIHYLNRAQVVDDVFALMRSGRMTYGRGFQILRFLRHELNYHVWDAAITGYTWLRNRLRHIPEKQAEFDAFVLSYMENAIQHYGFETSASETPTEIETRQIIMHFACTLGHELCVKESRERFIAFRNHPLVWVNIGIRRNAYVVGIREGGEEDFNFLVNLGSTTNHATDQLEILRALGSTKNSDLLQRYLDLTLTNLVRSHDKANSFNYALLGNRKNANTVLQWVVNNIDAMRVAYVEDSPARPVQTCLSNLAAYLDEPGLQQYQAWLESSQTGSAQYSTTLAAITSARNNMEWGNAYADTILGAARDGATKAVTSLAMLLIMAILAINA